MKERVSCTKIREEAHAAGLHIDQASFGYRAVNSEGRQISPRLTGRLMMTWLEGYRECLEQLDQACRRQGK